MFIQDTFSKEEEKLRLFFASTLEKCVFFCLEVVMINMVGKKIGRLKVISFYGLNKSRNARWNCICSCGKKIIITGSSLRNKNKTQSCGCIRIELLVKRNTKHNLSKHNLFKIWYGMKARCSNVNNSRYYRYGGRGISVCSSWEKEFLPFYRWAISNGWEKGLTIDRKDNNGNYCPKNCHFVSRADNNRNTSTSKIWNIDGLKFNSTKIASKFFNVSASTISRWCQGYITTCNHFSPPKQNCFVVNRY